MITLYSGTPGSGKSLHVSRDIIKHLCKKSAVIANFPINTKLVKKRKGKNSGDFIYRKNIDLTADYLRKVAKHYNKDRKEGQLLLVIDEAGMKFNSRGWQSPDRMDWLEFFSQHRKLGYNIIMVSQQDRQIDKQMRAVLEYDVKHKKANNFKTLGLILSALRIPIFSAVTYWYGQAERVGAEVFRFRKRDSQIYDTMMLFGDSESASMECGENCPICGGSGKDQEDDHYKDSGNNINDTIDTMSIEQIMSSLEDN